MSFVQSGIARHAFISCEQLVKRHCSHGVSFVAPMHDPAQLFAAQSLKSAPSEIALGLALKHFCVQFVSPGAQACTHITSVGHAASAKHWQ